MKTNNDEKMTITTTLHYYYYDISKDDEKQEYLAMCKKLKEIGLIKFDSYTCSLSKWYKEEIKPFNNKPIILEIDYLFNNQWNTQGQNNENGLRVFDWSEALYPNRFIKEGYYLEQTEEMKYIRDNTFKCGYCWEHYGSYHNPIPKDGKCHKCSKGSYPPIGDYLELTILKPVSDTK